MLLCCVFTHFEPTVLSLITSCSSCPVQDLGMDYYVIGESFETSVPWDR